MSRKYLCICAANIRISLCTLGEQLQRNPIPFALLKCADKETELPLEKLGQFRWVSTSIVRFDPTTDWPPDLCFKLRINPKIKTYDGMALVGVPKSQGYKTRGLTMHIGGVLSKMARAATGGRWKSREYNGEPFHECPTDGIVLLQFSHLVVPSQVLDALKIDEGAHLQDWVGSCFDARREEQAQSKNADTPVNCVAVKPRHLHPRARGTVHELKLPKFSRITPLGISKTQTAFTELLTGEVPFKFHFKQVVMPTPNNWGYYEEFRPHFRRYKLYLTHGLKTLVAAAEAKQVRLLWQHGTWFEELHAQTCHVCQDLSSADLSLLKGVMQFIDLQSNRCLACESFLASDSICSYFSGQWSSRWKQKT